MVRLFLTLLAFSLCLSTTACSKSDKTGSASKTEKKKVDPMLATVPAETNYFLNFDAAAISKGFKSEAKKAIAKNADFSEAMANLKQSAEPSERFAGVLMESVLDHYLNDKMDQIGMPKTPRIVLYGIGMWPAITLQIEDPKAFETWLSTQEKAAKITAKSETFNQKTFRTYPIEAEVFSAFAVHEKTATFAVIPTELKAQMLPYVLRDKLPSKTLNDTDTLSKLAAEYKFSKSTYAYLNLVDFFKTLASRGEGLNKTMIVKEMSNFNLDTVCQDEVIGMLQKGPRFVSGLDRLTETESRFRFVWELEDGLATELMSIASATAEKGAAGGLASFGIAFDSGKSIDLFKKKAAELSTAPFKCKDLQEFNQEVAKANGQLMFVPPFARAFKGIQINISSITGSQGGMEVAASILLSVDNAPLVLDAIKGMLPMLATLPAMKPDAVPMPLLNYPLPAFAKSPHIALGKSALGISIGTNEQNRLKALVGAAAKKNSPFVSISYDFDKMSKALEAAKSTSPELTEAAAEFAKMGLSGASTSDVKFTKKGLEVSSEQIIQVKP